MMKCPIKGSKEWKTLISQLNDNEDAAWATWVYHGYDYPATFMNRSKLNGILGVRNNMSGYALGKLRRRVAIYNKDNKTGHTIEDNRLGMSDTYNPTIVINYMATEKTKQTIHNDMSIMGKSVAKNILKNEEYNPNKVYILGANQYEKGGTIYSTYGDALNNNEDLLPDSIKPGVQEVFESNPELANAVYSALGFTQKDDFKQTFKNSLWRGQESQPFIDKNGDLVLIPTYDSLFKSEGISFAENLSMAQEYGERYSKNPFIIEIDENYVDKIYPLDRQGGTKNYGKRVVGDENEQRFISKEHIIIPKDKFKIHKKELNYDFSEASTLHLVDKWAMQFIETDIAEYHRYGEVSQGYATEDKQYYIAVKNELKSRGVTKEELLFLKPFNPIEGEEIIKDAFNIEEVTQKDIDAFVKKQKELQQKYYNKKLDIKDSFGFKKTNIKIIEQPQLTPQQKQQAQQLYQSFLDVYLQDFLTTDRYYALEEMLVVNKIIDRKCN